MRFFKLGNTIFLASLLEGVSKNPMGQGMEQGKYKWKLTVFLSSESLKAVSYPLQTEKEADDLMSRLLEESKVVDMDPTTTTEE